MPTSLADPSPFSHRATGARGALFLHGFSGSPATLRGLAGAFAGAGFDVELPLLPGHGGDDAALEAARWSDWVGASEAAFAGLAARCAQVVVVGLSMGGGLACRLAAHHPTIAGLVAINPSTHRPGPEVFATLQQLLAAGFRAMPPSRPDIADPTVDLPEKAVPLAPMLSLFEGLGELALDQITVPLLLISSRTDHVVDPENGNRLAASARGPVERVFLDRGYHVATLDCDQARVTEAALAFASRVTAPG